MRLNIISALTALCLAAGVSSIAAAHEAHVHGVANMDLSLSGEELTLQIESPLASFISFEHEPATDAEQQEVDAMAAALRQGAQMFIPSEAAGCTLASSKLRSPVLSGEEHAAREAGHDHADIDISYSFKCSNPAALKHISAAIFRHFPALHQVNVQMVTMHGEKLSQSAAELTPDNAVLNIQ